ncbi:hypothetical protein Nepgr_022972 [Nepenthes gracilis]|uniref:Uncharacterized protein n=1 Tax=Nepenthes gracilis TaxID=150966 RepID=A0AAD3T1M0_NEPGR|nr:hypothetical protein Nepgr_022972 [Nepenthes gracilis]
MHTAALAHTLPTSHWQQHSHADLPQSATHKPPAVVLCCVDTFKLLSFFLASYLLSAGSVNMGLCADDSRLSLLPPSPVTRLKGLI